jgi:hypothetical protein
MISRRSLFGLVAAAFVARKMPVEYHNEMWVQITELKEITPPPFFDDELIHGIRRHGTMEFSINFDTRE